MGVSRALQRTAAALSVCESRVIWKSPLRSTGALRRLSLSLVVRRLRVIEVKVGKRMPTLRKSAVVAWAALGCLASPLHGAGIELTYVCEFLCMGTNGPVGSVVASNGLPGRFLVPTASSRAFYSVPPYFSDTTMSYSMTSFVSSAEIKVEGMNAVDASFAARKDPEGIDEANGYSRCDLVYSFAVTNP